MLHMKLLPSYVKLTYMFLIHFFGRYNFFQNYSIKSMLKNEFERFLIGSELKP